MMKPKLAAASLLLAMFVFASPAHAVAKFMINTADDVDGDEKICSLRAAFQNINTQSKLGIGGDAVENQNCPKGEFFNEIRFAVPKVVLKDQVNHHFGFVTLANGHIDGGGKTRLLHLSSAAAMSLERMTLSGGNGNNGSGGAILIEGEASLGVVASLLFNNSAGTDGGAVARTGSGDFHTWRSRFENNRAGYRGGAIHVGGSWSGPLAVRLHGSRFVNNEAVESGGAVDCSSPEIYLRVTQDNFMSNVVTGADGIGTGGAVSSFCEMDIEDSRFLGNSVEQGKGGALYDGAGATVERAFFQGNSAGLLADSVGQGGAYFADEEVFLRKSSFFDNRATDRAGALMIGDGAAGKPVTIANVTFDSNRAQAGGELRHGGAIWITGLSFPRGADQPELGYADYYFEFLSNTLVDNTGIEQLYLDPGPQNFLGEILFVNNVLRSMTVPGCGGLKERLQLRRPVPGSQVRNIQHPGKSCDGAVDLMPEYLAPFGGTQFGGVLGQAFRAPSVADPKMLGDSVLCEPIPVSNVDQLGNPRLCYMGAAEKPRPTTYPTDYLK